MNKTEIKRILGKELKPYLMDQGFNLYAAFTHIYVLNEGEKVIHFFFHFHSDGSIGLGPISITFYEVEDYILNIGIPSNKLVEQKKREKDHLPTIEFRTTPAVLSNRTLRTEVEVEDYAESFISFYENDVSAFMKKYNNIPAVFNALIESESKGKPWKELIYGMGGAFIRVLIISKLCGDPKYSEKFNKINAIFQGSIEWQPYWENYKIALKEIEPKYNLDKA